MTTPKISTGEIEDGEEEQTFNKLRFGANVISNLVRQNKKIQIFKSNTYIEKRKYK